MCQCSEDHVVSCPHIMAGNTPIYHVVWMPRACHSGHLPCHLLCCTHPGWLLWSRGQVQHSPLLVLSAQCHQELPASSPASLSAWVTSSGCWSQGHLVVCSLMNSYFLPSGMRGFQYFNHSEALPACPRQITTQSCVGHSCCSLSHYLMSGAE